MSQQQSAIALPIQVALAATDANGNATFTFSPPGVNTAWVGTLSIPGASPYAQVTAVIDGTTYGQWSGAGTWGPLLVRQSQVLTVTATNLHPSTETSCVLVGQLLPIGIASGAIPAPVTVAPAPATAILETNTQTSSAGGTATFTLGPVPTGDAWTGTISLPTAPATAQFVLSVGATAIGAWSGPGTFGPFQAIAGQTISVSATNLHPSTSYTIAFSGAQVPVEQASAAFPSPNSITAAPPAAVTSTNAQTSSGTGTATFTIGPVTSGDTWSGSIAVPAAPQQASFTVTVNSVVLGSWNGPSTFGPIQATSGQSITITATNLGASASYTAVFSGQSAPSEQMGGIFTNPNSLLSNPASSYASGILTTGTSKEILTPSSSTAQYLIQAASIAVASGLGTAGDVCLTEGQLTIGSPSGTNYILSAFSNSAGATYGNPGHNASSFGAGLLTPPGVGIYLGAAILLGTGVSLIQVQATVVYEQVAS